MFGDIIQIDDPKIQQWYEQIVALPPKLYNALNSLVTVALQKCFAEPPIDEEEPFGALMVFLCNVVWRLILQCIRAFPQIKRALILIESGSIQTSADVAKLEEEAKVLLTFKELSTCRPKFTYDSAFFSTVLAFLETQKKFATEADRIRAADTVHKLQSVLGRENGTNISPATFFDRLHGIFCLDMGLTEGEAEAHLAVTAFQAKENYVNCCLSRKENVNTQFNKRKAAPTEMTMEQKVYADIESEFGQMRADIYAIMYHLGIANKKHK